MSRLPKEKRRTLEALRRKLGGIEGAGGAGASRLPLGIPEIDGVLPGGGLRPGCVHEIGGDEAATGFCAALLGRVPEAERPLLWLARKHDLYLPGLVRYGIEPGRLLVVSGLRRRADVLWAMEEALRCGALGGVVAEAEVVDVTASRCLMLAAEGSGVPGLVLSREAEGRNAEVPRVPTAASRWRVAAVPGAGSTRWRVEMLHCRGGRPARWVVGWDEDGGRVLPSGGLAGSAGVPRHAATAAVGLASPGLPRHAAPPWRRRASRGLARRAG